MPTPRPTGVTVMAILAIVFGPLGLCARSFSLPILMLDPAKGTAEVGYKPYLENDLLRHQMQASVVLGALAGVGLLAAGIGMLSLRPWARTTALVWATYTIVASIVDAVFMVAIYRPALEPHLAELDPAMRTALSMGAMGGAIGGGCVGLLLPIAMWIVLSRPTAKAAFGLGPAPAPSPPPGPLA